jgi:hypothetical protein
MYKVKMKTRWMAPGINYKPGDVLTLEDLQGKYLVESGSAELIEIIPKNVIESAVIKPIENAMIPKPMTRRRGK